MDDQRAVKDDDAASRLRAAWDLALRLLPAKVSKVTFEAYVRPIAPLGYSEEVVRLGVTSSFAREWLEKKASGAIRSALAFHLDASDLRVEFVVLNRDQLKALHAAARPMPETTSQTALPLEGDSIDPPSRRASSQPRSAQPTPDRRRQPVRKRAAAEQRGESDAGTSLNPRFALQDFLVGKSNRLAHAGAMKVVASPGNLYNPLFIYGGPACGKTHILQGIALAIRDASPDSRVLYVSGEVFAQQFIDALFTRVTAAFRKQFREADVWLVDDVQCLAGKTRTKEEFFHIFDTLYQNGKQIVISSDRSPRDLNDLDERMRSRFQSGLIVDIGPPDLNTRVAILRAVCSREGLAVPDDAVQYIAGAIQSNIRALEGAVTRLAINASITGAPISLEMAPTVLGEYYIDKPIWKARLRVQDIVAAVADRFNLQPSAITGPGRTKDVALARHVAMYLCRELLPAENSRSVAAAFGGRDHTTVVKACQKLRSILPVEENLADTIREIHASLQR